MNEQKCTVSLNYEAECERLRKEMDYRESKHCEEKDSLKREIEELKKELMIYEQKWSVIELIFGK